MLMLDECRKILNLLSTCNYNCGLIFWNDHYDYWEHNSVGLEGHILRQTCDRICQDCRELLYEWLVTQND
jgi:hypothetical protein